MAALIEIDSSSVAEVRESSESETQSWGEALGRAHLVGVKYSQRRQGQHDSILLSMVYCEVQLARAFLVRKQAWRSSRGTVDGWKLGVPMKPLASLTWE